MALDWTNASLAAIIDPHYFITLDSYRINRFLDDGSLAHLALGPLAQQMQDCRDAMFEAKDSNDPNWFETAGGHRFFHRDGDELWIKDEYYFDPPLTLFDDDLKVTFRARASNLRISIPADAAVLTILSGILPNLRANVSLPTLYSLLDATDRSFAEYLEGEGLVAAVPFQDVRARTDYRVTLVGHSCLSIESPRGSVLIDPLLVVRHKPSLNLTNYLHQPLDAIIISHPHWDHFNLDSLLLASRDIPIVIPRARSRASIVNIDMLHVLRQMGFRNVISAEPWEVLRFGEIGFVPLPFFGEGSGREGRQDWQTYLMLLGGRRILGLVDACADSFGSMDDAVERVRREFGPVDALFSPCADFQFQISQYQRRPFALSRCLEQFTGSAADTLRWASLAEAETIVPYAEFIYEESDLDRPPSTSAQKGSQRDLFRLASPEMARKIQILSPGGSLKWRPNGAGPLEMASGKA